MLLRPRHDAHSGLDLRDYAIADVTMPSAHFRRHFAQAPADGTVPAEISIFRIS